MTQEALNLALEALEVVTKELLAIRDELAERGARPKTNAFHQKLWDSSFKAYTDHALPAATAIKEALAQPWVDLTKEEKQECVNKSIYHTAWSSDVDLDTLIDVVQQKLKDKNENR